MKTCGKCGTEKESTEFSSDKGKKDGLCSHCKSCMSAKTRAWSAANKERKKAANAAWEAENRDRLKPVRREYNAARYAADPQRFNARNAAYRIKNAEKVRLRHRDYREANRDRAKETAKKWLEENPHAGRIKAHNYRSRKRANGGQLSPDLAAILFKRQRGKCACGCGMPLGTDYHLDHIMPLALGGSNTDDNIQILRGICNRQKCAKHPVDFMQHRGFLI